MSKMTDGEINIAAIKHASLRIFVVILLIIINTVFAVKIGWDIRSWYWWLFMPPITIFAGLILVAWETR